MEASPSPTQRPWSVVAGIALTLAGCLAGIAVLVRLPPVQASFGFAGFQVPLALSFAAAGAVILVRRPGNRIGLLLLLEAVVSALQFPAQLLPVALSQAGADPDLVTWAAWGMDWIWVPAVTLIALLFARFPDGEPVSPAWGRLLPALAISSAFVIVAQMVTPGPLFNFPAVRNPLGLEGPVGPALRAAGFVAYLSTVLLSALSLVVRWRRSSGDTREQLKWLAAAAIPFAVGGIFASTYPVASYLMIAAGMAIPAAIAIAVLRYRLYDIDHLVSRTFVYGALTAILAGVYTAALKLFNELFLQVTGAESEGAVILATLVLAAAFTPVRKALETVIDRRFKPQPAAPSDAALTGPTELEALLRRVIREELGVAAAARSDPAGTARTRDGVEAEA